MDGMKKLIYLLFLTITTLLMLTVCNTNQSLEEFESFENIYTCETLANKIESLDFPPNTIYFPEGSRVIDIYDILETFKNENPSLEIDGIILTCKGKAKTSLGDYPIEFYATIANRLEYIIVETQGKRKWIFKWKA